MKNIVITTQNDSYKLSVSKISRIFSYYLEYTKGICVEETLSDLEKHQEGLLLFTQKYINCLLKTPLQDYELKDARYSYE